MNNETTRIRNILVIAYYFPPMGLSGVQRTLKFVKFLPKFGWKPTVLTVTPTGYFAHDPSLLEELDPAQVEIVRAGSLDPNRLFKNKGNVAMPSERMRKVLTYTSDMFFIPDNKIGWRKKALQAASKLYESTKFDVIFATAPPFTDFLIGMELRRRFRTPLVLDYRDPWHAYPFKYFPTPMHRWKHSSLERQVLQASAKVITTNRRVKELILKKYEFLGYEDVVIIPQGYDPDDFPHIDSSATRSNARTISPATDDGDGQKFRITHTGAFHGDRTPKYFLQALKKVLTEHPELADKIEARFVGTFQKEYLKLIKTLGLEACIVPTGYLSHRESVQELMRSDVLWLMVPNDSQSPGKVYEYIGAQKPILACVPEGFIKQAVTETGAAKVVGPTDVNAIADAIYEFYDLYRQNRLPHVREEIAYKYNRVNLTNELSKVLGFLVDQ